MHLLSRVTSCVHGKGLLVVLLAMVLGVIFTCCDESPSCVKVEAGPEVSLPRNAISFNQKVKHSRSVLDCVSNCLMSFPFECLSVFRDSQTGSCYEFNTILDQADIQMASSSKRGQYVELLSETVECGERNCTNEELCFRGCGDGEWGTEECVVDHRNYCPHMMEYSNIRYFRIDFEVNTTSPTTVLELSYPKKFTASALRVNINLIAASSGTQGGCSHWFAVFDEKECNNPGSIAGFVDYKANTGNYYRPINIDGTCYGLNDGDVNIQLKVKPCDKMVNTVYSTSGYKVATNVMVMEILPMNESVSEEQDILGLCPGLNRFNYKFYSWIGEEYAQVNLGSSHVIAPRTFDYKKLSNETGLYIKLSIAIGVESSLSSKDLQCAKWFIKLNDVECSPNLDTQVLSSGDSDTHAYLNGFIQTTTVEGMCENTLEAGSYIIALHLERCLSDSDQPTNILFGSKDVPSTLHVEEVRLATPLSTIITTTEMSRTEVINLVRASAWNAIQLIDNGVTWSFKYHKLYAETGLRLSASGDHKTEVANGYTRWYFQIDGSECTNPGKIEGIIAFDHKTVYHRAMLVGGVCQGIEKGDKVIEYVVAQCPGCSGNDTETGWATIFTIFVEELRLTEVTNCSGNRCGV